MFTKRVTTLAFHFNSCMLKTLSNSSRTLSYGNSYRRFSRSIVANCATTETTQAPPKNNYTTNEESNEKSEEAQLNDRLKSLQEEVNDLKDKYQRALADRENTRLRLQKEVVDAKVFGIQGFCKDLLEVSDVFRRALENVPKQQIEKADKEIKNLYDGITMTEGQLHIVFARNGLHQVTTEVGQKFDPSVHEAMLKIPVSDGQQSGTIGNVFRTGWQLRERCIRTAQVSVFKDS